MATKRHDDSAPAPPHPAPALANRAVWELEADARLLDPGPGGLGRRYDVLVVGGGVVGLATAALCARAGLGRIAVVDRERMAAGPSGRGAGVLAPALHNRTDPECLVDLGHASLALWRQLDREYDGELGVQRLDLVQTLPDVRPSAPAARLGVQPRASDPPPNREESPAPRLAPGAWVPGEVPPASDPPPGGEVLGEEAARALEPRLAPGHGGVLLGDQARVHPLRLAAALARRAGTTATGVQVTGIEPAGPGALRVRTGRGDVEAGAVVLATGSGPRLEGLPLPHGQLLVKGTLVATAPAPFRLRLGVAGLGGLAFQLPDGRLLFGNTFDATDGSPEVRPETLVATRADLEALVPDAAGLPLSHAWSCFRPATAAGLPVIDKLEGLGDVWVTYGHFRTGFLLAAATGEALATWISSGERPEGIAPFSARW